MAKATSGPQPGALIRTYRAQTAALTRGYGVQQGTADDQAAIAAAATRVLGVVDESTVNIGDAVGVVMFGPCVAIAGAAINAGDVLKTDANGCWIPANAADIETGGKALSSAAAQYDEFIMLVHPACFDAGALADALPDLVVSGGVVTDDASGLGKINVTACKYVHGAIEYTAPAIASLATADGRHAYVNPTTNTIAEAAAIPAGGIPLADLAVAAGVVTPTAKRPKLTTGTF